MKKQRKITIIVLFAAVACLSIACRLWKINGPVADWHSFRQADTASVARLFTTDGIDFLHPRYHDLSNIQSGKDNPQGWRMVEFPLYQGIGALLYKAYSTLPIEIYLRLITILCSTFTGLFLGILVMRRTTVFAGFMAFFTYALLPFSIFYGRAILPDSMMVFLSVLSLYVLDTKEKEVSWMQAVLSGIFAALALLVKPQAAFLLLPALVLVVKRPLKKTQFLKFFLWGLIAVTPIILWRIWISQYPEGIPAFDWLLNKDNIRLKGAWFFWLFADRIGRLILGYWGLILLGFGLVAVSKHEGMVFRLLFIGSLLYLVIIAGGNVQHDYYQILLLPILCIYLGRGIVGMWETRGNNVSNIKGKILCIISMVFAFAFSWYTIRTYYWINKPEIIEAGIRADALLPKDAKVIAPYSGDTTLLYQTKRSGWPIGFEIDKKISMGATAYVTVASLETDMEAKELADMYTVLAHTDTYTIIDLTKKK